MKKLHLILIGVLIFGFTVVLHTPSASAVCINMSGSPSGADVLQGPYKMPAGSWITFTMIAAPGAGTAIHYAKNGVTAGVDISYTSPHTLTVTFDQYTDGFWFYLEWQFDGDLINYFEVISSECNTSCEASIPSDAVVGQFNENAEIYWMPGEMVQPPQIIDAGKTYHVAGQDATGMYRKVLVACEWVWVRAGTVGPNYDEVWNGQPLPTRVVD